MKRSGTDSQRYPAYGPEVNAILDLARAARQLEHAMPGIPAAGFVQGLERPAQNWWWSLIDIILDYEQRERRHADFWQKWKRWRSKREFIKRLARQNVVLLGYGHTPSSPKRRTAKLRSKRR